MNLQNLIDNAQKLPNIPKVVQELIESFGDENVSNDAIAKKISADQVLTIKVLRAANSAHYGGNRKRDGKRDFTPPAGVCLVAVAHDPDGAAELRLVHADHAAG